MENKKIVRVIGMIIIIILIIILFLIVTWNNLKKQKVSDSNSNIIQNNTESNYQIDVNTMTEEEKKENEKIIKRLKKSSETERIRTYLGTYFKYIEKKDYDSAYKLLYPKFKENYFQTVEDFKKYIEELNLPEMLMIDYDDIYMQGEYYIVTVNIGDLLNRAALKQEKTLILQENGYNDYYISFKM